MNAKLSELCEVVRHSNAVAAGTTTITPSTPIDTQGYSGCLFVVELGAITAGAVTSAAVQQCDTSGGTYAALSGASVSIADDDDSGVVYLDVKEPRERYLKCVISRATQNAVLEGITAILYGPREVPVTQGATVAGGAAVVSPAES